jgi:signal transduction histidine kinase
VKLTLRLRVVAAAAAAILLAVVVVAVTVSVLVSEQLHSSLDRSLHDRAAEIAQLSVAAPAVLTQPGALDARVSGEQLSVEVLDRHGRLLARSLSLGAALLPADAAPGVIASGRPVYRSARLGRERLRLYAAPLPSIGGAAAGGAVVVAASTGDIRETLDRLHLIALVSAAGATLLAAAAAFVLVRRALRPLDELSRGAGEIERTADAARRLPEPATGDEVSRLAATLNRMLAALERARERERRFLADASHELRSPVTALRGNAEYLRRHGFDEATVADLAADAERLSLLIDDLLALAREDAGERPGQQVDLAALARAVADGDPRIRLEAPVPVLVAGEPTALHRAASNLLENARVHGPLDGPITIRVSSADGVGRLSVRDEGVGLAADETAQAFERFWRGDHERPGSGLGLAIVKATAERHGGRVAVAGSEFALELPLLKELSNESATPGTDARKGHAE